MRHIELKDADKSEFKAAGTAMVIGFFDGVHLGHQKIINKCIAAARGKGRASVALTFDRPPLNIRENRVHKRLILPYGEKIRIIGELGIDLAVTAVMKKSFLDLGPEEFCDRVLIGIFNVKELYIGRGFRFGKDAEGDTDFLKRYLGKKDIKVHEVDLIRSKGEVISSTVIRKYYKEGNIKRVAELLGRNPYLIGKVIRGAGRGKLIGVPTVNMSASSRLVIPRDGVYLGRVSKKQGTGPGMPSVINIGDNPTFGDRIKRVESHIIDFDGDLYGKKIMVEFNKRLRQEIKFNSAGELKEQIAEDIKKGRRYFKACKGAE